MSEPLPCPCLDHGPKRPDIVPVRDVGVDETEGRFAGVDVIRCERLWLHYAWEMESETASGCWFESLIDDAIAATIAPGAAFEYILAAPWRVQGGSFHGHSGERVDGPIERPSEPAAPQGGDPAFLTVYAKHPFVIRLTPGEAPMFFNRKTALWHPWPGPIPAPARPISKAAAWKSIYQDAMGLDFGTLDRPHREWPRPNAG